MLPKPHHIAMRQLIRRLAATPAGYCMSDATHLPGYQSYASNHTDRLIKAGELVRVKVPGHRLRFVKDQAMAEALTAAMLAGKKKRKRSTDRPAGAPCKPPHTGALHRFMRAAADRPEGVTRTDCAHIPGFDGALTKCANCLIAAGALHRVKVQGWPNRYFARQSDAAAWEAATSARIPPPPKPRAPRPQAVKPPKVAKPKVVPPVKAAKPAKPPKAVKPQMQVVERKPYHPPAPRRAAEIIWPAHYRKTTSLMPPGRYEVSAQPVRRIGQPGFSMSI
jgi:hypothetical protein